MCIDKLKGNIAEGAKDSKLNVLIEKKRKREVLTIIEKFFIITLQRYNKFTTKHGNYYFNAKVYLAALL